MVVFWTSVIVIGASSFRIVCPYLSAIYTSFPDAPKPSGPLCCAAPPVPSACAFVLLVFVNITPTCVVKSIFKIW